MQVISQASNSCSVEKFLELVNLHSRIILEIIQNQVLYRMKNLLIQQTFEADAVGCNWTGLIRGRSPFWIRLVVLHFGCTTSGFYIQQNIQNTWQSCALSDTFELNRFRGLTQMCNVFDLVYIKTCVRTQLTHYYPCCGLASAAQSLKLAKLSPIPFPFLSSIHAAA